jgi:hypothetical protein
MQYLLYKYGCIYKKGKNMHNLTPTQIDELLKLVANGVKAYHTGNAVTQAQALINWMQTNAPDYLK